MKRRPDKVKKKNKQVSQLIGTQATDECDIMLTGGQRLFV